MKVLTVKSADVLEGSLQTEVHHSFGMEHYTDYVFIPRDDTRYSATIVIDATTHVIDQVVKASKAFPGREFLIDDLDLEQNCIDRYFVQDGEVTGKQQSGWDWKE